MTCDMPYFFSPKITSENDEFSFDFTNNLQVGETLVSSTVTATPSGLTIGTPFITGGAIVTAFISGGSAGVSYVLTFEAVTTNARTIGFEGILNVVQ